MVALWQFCDFVNNRLCESETSPISMRQLNSKFPCLLLKVTFFNKYAAQGIFQKGCVKCYFSSAK